MQPALLTPEEIAASLSNYSGHALDINYTGEGDDHLDFNGGSSFFDNRNDQDRFVFSVTNASSSVRSFYLNPGINRTIQGTLTDGAFAAVEDTGGATSLTGTAITGGSSLAKLLAYTQLRPTAITYYGWQTTSIGVQQSLAYVLVRQHPITDGEIRTRYFQSEYNPEQYHDQINWVKDSILVLDSTEQIKIQVAGSSTLTYYLSFGATLSNDQALRNKLNKAYQTAKQNPNTVIAAANRGNIRKALFASR